MSDEWLEKYAAALGERCGLERLNAETNATVRSALLDLARVVAHGSQRRNAPLATYLAGRYVAARVAQDVPTLSAVEEAAEIARDTLPPPQS